MYRIEPCSKEDLHHVLELTKIWSSEDITIGYANVKHSIDELEKRLNGFFYIAKVDGIVAGYVFGEIRQGKAAPVIPHDEAYMEIFELFVHPVYRSQGIGKNLMEAILNKAKEINVTRSLIGSSNIRWKDTAKFYEECGFTMWYIQMIK